MKKLWVVFVAIFVASFAVLGWVGTEIFRQAPPIPHEVVTAEVFFGAINVTAVVLGKTIGL